jgi:hypothetical protein
MGGGAVVTVKASDPGSSSQFSTRQNLEFYSALLEAEAETAEALKEEMTSMKRDHAKYTSARIATELEKAQVSHAAGAERVQAAHDAELEKAVQVERGLRTELAQLKKGAKGTGDNWARHRLLF